MLDQRVCDRHGGKSPQALNKAAERRLETKVRGLLSSRGCEPVTDPVGELMKLAGEAVRWKEVLSELVDKMRDTIRYEGIGGEQLRAEIAVFERSMDRCAQILGMMARLNLAERQVRIDEAKAELLIRLVATAMRKVNLPPQSQADLWAVLKDLIAREQASDPMVIDAKPAEEESDPGA